MRYAQINSDGVAFAVSDVHSEIDADDMIQIDPGADVLGLRWTGAGWESASPVLNVVITGIESDQPATLVDLAAREVTAPVGATLTCAAEMQMQGQRVPLSQTFRVPIVSRDGSRERVVLAQMVDGQITFRVGLDESRVWLLTQDRLNSALPPESHVRFEDFVVYAVEV